MTREQLIDEAVRTTRASISFWHSNTDEAVRAQGFDFHYWKHDHLAYAWNFRRVRAEFARLAAEAA